MSHVPRPDKLPRFASDNVVNSVTGINNVVEPPESKKNVGWNYLEPPGRNFLNWIHRKTYEWLNYLDDQVIGMANTKDGAGAQLVNQENVMVILYAIDTTTPANYIHAVGYRSNGSPSFNLISNNVLTLGTADTDGTQAISGGTAANIIVNVQFKPAP